MASDRLTSFPIAFTAGTSFRLDLSLDAFPASDGGTINVFFSGQQKITPSAFTTSTDGDAFTIDVLAATTTNWRPGVYNYTVQHTDTAGIIETAISGRIEILPDPAKQSQTEARSFSEIMVDRIKALLKELALNPYKQIMISDKQYTSQNLPELESLLRTVNAI
jgi:hypothetical protein